MAVIIVLFGLCLGILADSWVLFAIAVVIAFGFGFVETAWIHDHMHKLYNGEED